MKRLIALLLAAVLALSVAACGGGDGGVESETTAPNNSEITSIDNENNNSLQENYKLGDTVSTDILEFTLDTAELAIALDNGKKDIDGNIKDTYMMPKEYNPENDIDNPFVAPKGHTFLSITYTINNLDRAFVNFNDKEDNLFTIEYQNNKYNADIENGLYRIYNERLIMNDSGAMEEIKPNIWNEFKNNYYGVGLQVGEKETRRFYIDIPTDVETLTDDFNVIVSIPNSDGTKTEFTYLITH